MAFQISPGIVVEEQALDLIVPSVPTSIGAIVGDFQWGPANEIVLIDSEEALVRIFGKPTDRNAKDWFCARNYLAYSKDLRVIRVLNTDGDIANAMNLVGGILTNSGGALTKVLVSNKEEFDQTRALIASTSNGTANVQFIARHAGADGNRISVSYADDVAFPTWAFAGNFEYAPQDNQFALVVLVDDQVVEKFLVSSKPGTVDGNGQSFFADNVINTQSQYIYILTENLIQYDGAGDALALSSGATPIDLVAGADHATNVDLDAERIVGWNIFAAAEDIDVNFLITGGAGDTVKTHVIQNVAEVRRDCVAFVSPPQEEVVGTATPTTDITTWRKTALNINSSYAFLDGNYKYQYDYYNEKYRWIPLNGDTAGLMARTSYTNDPWWSPAGVNRGQIKNVVKLAFNPSKAMRDELYKVSVNPVASFPGEGVQLFGDKTLMSQATSFSRINVRMLFIILEKAIAKAARAMLFEFNDEYTRARFTQMVEPFLRDVQARRGIQRHNGADGYAVIADERVNTPFVIDSNEFRAMILVKPNKSINFIKLTFAATDTGVVFEELAETLTQAA